MRHQQASSARLHGCNWSASLCDLGPLLKLAVCCSVEAAMLQTLWGNTATCMRRNLLGQDGRKGIVCQSLSEDFDQLQSQTTRITLLLTRRYMGISQKS